MRETHTPIERYEPRRDAAGQWWVMRITESYELVADSEDQAERFCVQLAREDLESAELQLRDRERRR